MEGEGVALGKVRGLSCLVSCLVSCRDALSGLSILRAEVTLQRAWAGGDESWAGARGVEGDARNLGYSRTSLNGGVWAHENSLKVKWNGVSVMPGIKVPQVSISFSISFDAYLIP